MEEVRSVSDYAKMLGRAGGKKTAQRGRKYYSEIGAKGAEARWSKKNAKG